MKIASVEYENGVSQILNSHYDKNQVLVDKFDKLEDLVDRDLTDYDLILVDMSHNKCLQVIHYIKQTTNIPVIYLTDRRSNNPYEQKIDDKEFVIHSNTREEFIDSVFRKVQEINDTSIINLGFCTMEEDNGIFRIGNDILDLTKFEIAICACLISNMGRTLSKEEIVNLMEEKGLKTTERSVREHIRKIRLEFDKANLNPIETVNRKGYRWVLDKCEP
ncbi:winged helix-turn-helix domain-containing protein [Anaerococcus sp. Marseille-Q7828]|uniref:winged helix-turn-helix domain-containing protein n=1 Tax=Anaerococcus sp. Marseille-Q7828 TaxID=3036300 RepID=UPI0024AD5FD7|nr:winged helix-turn-helix domain-containing protein [Anaerococcus sp. Marseille-Q7828]